MILIPKHNLAFVHIPRTGGSTITKLLAQYTEVTDDDYPSSHPMKDGKIGWQRKYHDRYDMHSKWNTGASWFRTFSFVRDPLDRALSMQSSGYWIPDSRDMSLSEYLETLEYIGYLETQRSYLCDKDGRMRVLLLGRFERFETDLRMILSGYHIELPTEIPNLNPSSIPQMGYTEEDEAVVRELFAEDYKEFMY